MIDALWSLVIDKCGKETGTISAEICEEEMTEPDVIDDGFHDPWDSMVSLL